MDVTLLRHATLLVELDGLRLLVDPMLAPAGTAPAVEGTPAQRPNPLVELPEIAEAALDDLDALLVTHLHTDHFDPVAAERLPAELPVLCQPGDEERLRGSGFADVRPVSGTAELGGLTIHRTGGRHGHGELAEAMGPVSGFVLGARDGRRLWIAGDTVWCDEVEAALARFAPAVTVLNAGGARFLEGEPITMTTDDVARVVRAHPDQAVVAVHMEAVNHCLLTRAALRDELAAQGLEVLIPADGETLRL